jgi:hypothetical protein
MNDAALGRRHLAEPQAADQISPSSLARREGDTAATDGSAMMTDARRTGQGPFSAHDDPGHDLEKSLKSLLRTTRHEGVAQVTTRPEAHPRLCWLWRRDRPTVVELTHNWEQKEPPDGQRLRHLAIGVPDVYKTLRETGRRRGEDTAPSRSDGTWRFGNRLSKPRAYVGRRPGALRQARGLARISLSGARRWRRNGVPARR